MPCDWSSDVCRSEEHTSELQSHDNIVCRLLLEKKNRESPDRTSPHGRMAARAGARDPRRTCVRRAVRCPPRRTRSRSSWLSPAFIFFNDTATTEIYTLSLHDALPI